MSKHGKNINMFLIDGDASGLIKASLSNWKGVAYKVPRERLNEFKSITASSFSSVYFLFGEIEDNKPAVYIGQAGIRKNGGGILQRLIEHDKSKEFWTDAVVFTTTDDTFGPTELSYLENSFCNMATEATRYEVQNSNEPTPGNITEEKESELSEYSDYAHLILGVLGYKVFDKAESSPLKEIKATSSKTLVVPALPTEDLKIGAFVQVVMENLSNSGYKFSEADINLMCSKEWSNKTLGLNYPFFRLADNIANIKDQNGHSRYYSKKYIFGDFEVFISKEWFDKTTSHYKHQDEKFIAWYEKLKKTAQE